MAEPVVLQLDLKRCFQWYAAGEHQQLAEHFLHVLDHFSNMVYLNESSVSGTVTPFLSAFLTLFTQPDFIVAKKDAPAFLSCQTLISNLVAMTPIGNTDAYLEIVGAQPDNFIKVLTLYSARNHVHIDRDQLFEADPGLASLWYSLYCEIYKTGLVRDDVVRNLQEHLRYRAKNMILSAGLAVPYFASTYVDGQVDRIAKPLLNALVQSSNRMPPLRQPNPGKIAVICDYWYASHSVYRNYAEFVRQLQGFYHLTLIHVLTAREELDVGMFDEVKRLEIRAEKLDVEWLLENRFQLIYYPDVGMTDPSILLANLRLAPIQICSPGHSVSTWGAEIDYYVSGAEVEIPERPERNYSERLILLPGLGVIHNKPRYQRRGTAAGSTGVTINCPWSAHKMCHRFLSTLRTLVDSAEVPLRLRIFPGTGISQHNGHRAFLKDLYAVLGEKAKIEVLAQLPYADYMAYLEQGDLTLDSYHFAGCNTVADSLFVGKPIVVWQGDKWYNRIGPAMLRRVGLDTLIATSEEEYLAIALRLIRQPEERSALGRYLESVDLDTTLFSNNEAPLFREAVDDLIDRHEELLASGSKKALRLENGRLISSTE